MVVSQTSDKFDFFNNVEHEELYKALKQTNDVTTHSKCSGDCPYIAYSNFTIRKYDNLCKKLNKLFSYLCFKEGKLVILPNLKSSDYEYLNYWLNVELENNKKKFSEIKEQLNNNMKNDENSCFNKDTFKEKLHHIEKSDFEYMNILDNLYKNYAEIIIMGTMGSNGQEGQCYKYSEKCYNNYESAIMKNPGKNTDFYKALQKFKEKYISLYDYDMLVGICDTKELKKLRSDEEILETLSKMIAEQNRKKSMVTNTLVPTIGLTSSFIFLYMFTPFGTWIRSKIKPRNNVISQSEKRHHPLEHTYDPEKNNDAKNPYNISYGP
ncbi:PIR protein [Plasmodium vivax]|uniref:VIR protein n=1 Tax=Plasmodium vivax TaxID=5855 RepID=A0A565A619_PLAVI|nr:PIR protein [Plasmodium vivax]